MRAFINSLPEGALVADVGCGNGKYFGVRPDLAILASDRSPRLAGVAALRLDPALPQWACGAGRADVMVADALSLPYRDAVFDGLLCIAVRPLSFPASIQRAWTTVYSCIHARSPVARLSVRLCACVCIHACGYLYAPPPPPFSPCVRASECAHTCACVRMRAYVCAVWEGTRTCS